MKESILNTQKAFRDHCLGLNSKEIAKLIDCSYRTVQNYMSAENWKEKRKNLNNNNLLLIFVTPKTQTL